MERTIQVTDLPTGVSKQSLEDKLVIHFLRARNGGGEIIDVVFPTQSLSSALIIFEQAEVAQRVLQIENHILAIDGKLYKLKVKSANTEIKVDQVIPHISMTIDYGKLFGGKRLMKHFQKMHKDIQFGFDQKAEQCIVGGTFSAIRELTGEIHRLLSLNPDQSSVNPDETKPQLHDSPESTAFSSSNSIWKDAWKSNAVSSAKGNGLELQTKFGLESSVRGTDTRGINRPQAKERHTATFEDYTLLMDSDIYMYIQKFYKDRYQNILHKYLVEVLDITDEGVTMVFLQAATGCLDSGRSLQRAHQELSQLYQDFELKLRKEQIKKESLTSDVKLLQNIYVSLQAQFPQINFNEDVNYFYLIGTSYDCSLAKKYLQDSKEELEVRSQEERRVTPVNLPESHQTSTGSIPHSLRDFKDSSSFSQVGSPKTDVRKDHKLAPTFNGKKEVDRAFKAGNSVAKDDSVLNPEQTVDQLMTGFSKTRSLLMDTRNWDMQQVPQHSTAANEIFTNNDKTLTSGTGQLVASNKESLMKTDKDFSVLSDQAKLLKSPDKTGSDILFKGDEDSSSLCTSKGHQHNKSSKAHGPVKPCHFETSAGTLFHQGDLLDTRQTVQSITATKSAEGRSKKTPLRKTNSFSGCLKSKRSTESVNNFQEKPTEVDLMEKGPITEEMLIDSDVWSYLKDIHDSTIRQIRVRTEVMVTEQLLGDTTALKLTALNRDNVIAAKEDILSLYTLVMRHLTQQLLSYRDLGIEISTEKTVEQWRSTLKRKFPKVQFIASQAGFHIIGTYEHCLKVLETFKTELRYTFLEDLSWMDTASISASNQHPFLDTEKLKDTEGQDFLRSADGFSSLGQVPHARKPEDFSMPDFYVDSVSLKTTAKKEPPLFQLDKEFTETVGHGKAAEGSKLCNFQPDGEEQCLNKQLKYPNERDGPVLNSMPFMDQKRSPKTLDEGSGCEFLQDQADHKCQKMIKQIGDVEGVKPRKTLPDKFHLAPNKLAKESLWYNKESSFYCGKVDSGTQSLPVLPYTGTSALSLHQRNNGQYITESATDSKDQLLAKYVQQQTESSEIVPQESKTTRNFQQSQPRSPAIGMDAQELNESSTACHNCKKSGKLSKVDCGHVLCEECHMTNQQFCLACGHNAVPNKNESQSVPTMTFAILNFGLSGFSKELTLQITYDIPDGIQQENDPNPGEPFKGGQFKAYLPDTRDGKKVLVLLQKAFNRGLIFKIVPDPPKLAKVTWNEIPHKTATTGGKTKNGYPDVGYLKKVLAVLANYRIQ